MDISHIFQVSTYGEYKPYNDTLSQARVRIFYKGVNRNSTYITEEFAEKLLSSLPYTPVKGIFDDSGKDFKDHGKARAEGRIYGVVPETHNFSWEDFEDEDGITRTYACADVLLFTGIYPEATKISNKGQSMELYVPSITGEWQTVDGKRVFVYSNAAFLGLQVLGDKVEPCFEGAEFFSLYKKLVKKLKGGKERMLKFKLSDSQKAEKLFMSLNPNYNEEGGWEFDVALIEVYDEYALVYDYNQSQYLRVSYTKNDEADTIELGDKVQVFRVDVTQEELDSLNRLRTANENTFVNVDEVFTKAANRITELEEALTEEQTKLEAAQTEYEVQLSAKENELNTQFTEKEEELNTQISEKQSALDSLTEELEQLKEFKLKVEKEAKHNIINEFVDVLSTEIIESFTAQIDNFTAVDLKKELAFKAYETKAEIFNVTNDKKVPGHNMDEEDFAGLSGAARLIAKHKKNGGR